MSIAYIRKFLARVLLLLFALYFYPLNSCAIDRGYDGDTPLFVTISTDWCFACKILDPIVEELKQEYYGRITFVNLNATSDESTTYSQQLALNYGILDFFNGNRNAFPRVAVYCPGALSPHKNLLGANKKEFYRGILDDLLLNSDQACNINGRPPVPDAGPERPNEPEQVETIAGRPEEPELQDRPKEVLSSGRPPELTFWTVGSQIPLYAYYQFLVLPKCTGDQIICSNYTNQGTQLQGDNEPVFKPWTPNATRNEKEFNNVVLKKGG